MSSAALVLFVLLAVGTVIYIVETRKTQPPTPPSPPPAVYWKCDQTQSPWQCIQTQDPKDYPTEAVCAQNCQQGTQYWGCEYIRQYDQTSAKTGACIQYDAAHAGFGPYQTQQDCNNAGQCTLPEYYSCTPNYNCVTCNPSLTKLAPSSGHLSVTCAYGPDTPNSSGDKTKLVNWNKCLQQCVAPVVKWSCPGTGQTCIQNPQGQYDDQASCNAVCAVPATKWSCSTSGGAPCVSDPNGQYSDEAACNTGCCTAKNMQWCAGADKCCDPANCESCVGNACVNKCVSSKDIPCPQGVACKPSTNGPQCDGTWCPVSGSPGQYTACPGTGKCADGSNCQTVQCGNYDCGFCNGSTGQCELWDTLCSAGYQCICDSGKQYPDPSCYRSQLVCPAGQSTPVGDLYICPKEPATSTSYWCPNVLTGGTCPDGSSCSLCSQVGAAACCVCCPTSICGGFIHDK